MGSVHRRERSVQAAVAEVALAVPTVTVLTAATAIAQAMTGDQVAVLRTAAHLVSPQAAAVAGTAATIDLTSAAVLTANPQAKKGAAVKVEITTSMVRLAATVNRYGHRR